MSLFYVEIPILLIAIIYIIFKIYDNRGDIFVSCVHWEPRNKFFIDLITKISFLVYIDILVRFRLFQFDFLSRSEITNAQADLLWWFILETIILGGWFIIIIKTITTEGFAELKSPNILKISGILIYFFGVVNLLFISDTKSGPFSFFWKFLEANFSPSTILIVAIILFTTLLLAIPIILLLISVSKDIQNTTYHNDDNEYNCPYY